MKNLGWADPAGGAGGNMSAEIHTIASQSRCPIALRAV